MEKVFDCVEMKRKAQEVIYEKMKHMTEEEKLRYWQERDVLFKEKMEAAKSKKSKVVIPVS